MNMGNRNILLAGPLPPPIGGQSVLVESILYSKIQGTYTIHPFNISHGNNLNVVQRLFLSIRFLSHFVISMVKTDAKIVHIHTSVSPGAFFEKSVLVLLAKLFFRKTLLHIHGGKLKVFWSNSGKLSKILIRFFINLNDSIIVLSEPAKEFIKSSMGYKGKIYVLPNAVPEPTVENNEHSDKGNREKIVFLYVGNISIEKGLLDILEALQHIPSDYYDNNLFEIRIMGAGSTALLEELVTIPFSKSPYKNVIFIGSKVGEEKWAEFSNADVFLLPSHSEDMPISILEAMMFGLPVLATDVGAIPDVIEDGENGFIVPVQDPVLLAQKICRLIDGKDCRLVMGRNNYLKAKAKYSFEQYETKLIEVYNSIFKE